RLLGPDRSGNHRHACGSGRNAILGRCLIYKRTYEVVHSGGQRALA
nr:hypothetical protein [Tanacetum cinerariifolium]